MIRPTDVQRGAYIALDIAVCALVQPDLFDAGLPVEFWREIEAAANDQLDECAALQAALA